jgi:hypothetical protein
LTTAARLLRDTDRDIAAARILADRQATLAFQLQAQVDAPSAMYLSNPRDYLGGFRDHCLDYGFALSCQATQMLSLLAVYRQMTATAAQAVPAASDRYREACQAVAGEMCRFPRVLPRPAARVPDPPPARTPQLPAPPPARAVPKR